MTFDPTDDRVVQHVCPVCGFTGLFESQFSDGNPSFEICHCCGTQFGYDDANTTHEELRRRWLRSGAKWWSEAHPPPLDWSAIEQLRVAGLDSERELPRWVQIPVGLVLGLLTLGLAFATVVGLFTRNDKAPVLSVVIGSALLLICLWVLEKCFRLLTGRKNRGGLMSPATLRVLSVFFLVIPIAGLFTGYYRKMGGVALFQAVMYFSAFLGLQRLARQPESVVEDRQPR